MVLRVVNGRTLLVVNADDYGLTPGVSGAVLDAHRRGVVTSTSVLALAPAFLATASWLADAPELGVGAHLAVVGEDPPLLAASEVPSLVDRRGRLASSWRRFAVRYCRGAVDADDVRREFAAQIEAVRTGTGRRLTHLDTHQHVHLLPGVSRILLDLAVENGIAALRVPRSSGRRPTGALVAGPAAALRRRARRRAVAVATRTEGFDEAGRLDEVTLERLLRRVSRRQLASVEVLTHPGLPDDADRARYRWGFAWEAEWQALVSPRIRALVDELGFRLGTYADLADLGARR